MSEPTPSNLLDLGAEHLEHVDGPIAEHLAEHLSADPLLSFPPERIALGETSQGELVVVVTEAGRQVCLEEHIPVECDFCRVTFARGDSYFLATLGMDETASVAGSLPTAGSSTEVLQELAVCARCEPVITREFDRFLELLWALRAPDPELATGREPYEDEGDVTETLGAPS